MIASQSTISEIRRYGSLDSNIPVVRYTYVSMFARNYVQKYGRKRLYVFTYLTHRISLQEC